MYSNGPLYDDNNFIQEGSALWRPIGGRVASTSLTSLEKIFG